MKGPVEINDGFDYLRPNRKWQCGAEAGCPLGPSLHGSCSGSSGCQPTQEGDRWHCNRSDLRGGPCAQGPTPDGECGTIYTCTPQRSLRASRGRWAVGFALFTFGILFVWLSSSWRNQGLAPGGLSRSHAQLIANLSSDATQQSCASCHAAGNATFKQWWAHTTGADPLQPTQSALCLKCHDKTIPRHLALNAHNVPPAELKRIHHELHADQQSTAKGQKIPHTGKVDPNRPFACAACHREHQGVEHNLAAMTNVSCQACHAEVYDDFANSHPEFTTWPYEQRTHIAFNHATHAGKHYPKEKQDFKCSSCHVEGPDGRQLTLGYQASCAECHDAAINTTLASGLSLLSLPSLDVASIEDAGHHIGRWPNAADFDFDGQLSPLTRLLLLADPQARSALQTLGSDFSFYDIDPDDASQLAAAALAVNQLKQLISDFTEQVPSTMKSRINNLLPQGSRPDIHNLTTGLAVESINAYRDRWFGSGLQRAVDAGFALPTQRRGTWQRDETTLSLRYLPEGHDDPWLRAWIDLAAVAANGPYAKLAKPLFDELTAPTAPGQCATCHTVERHNGVYRVHWKATDAFGESRGFTRFTHAPHLLQPQLSDCQSCHALGKSGTAKQAHVGNAAHATNDISATGFAPLSKWACANCHTKQAAGESCTQCHNYHIEWPSKDDPVGRMPIKAPP